MNRIDFELAYYSVDIGNIVKLQMKCRINSKYYVNVNTQTHRETAFVIASVFYIIKNNGFCSFSSFHSDYKWDVLLIKEYSLLEQLRVST